MAFKNRDQLLSCLGRGTIVNESNHILSSEQIEVLALGLDFIPFFSKNDCEEYQIDPRETSNVNYESEIESKLSHHVNYLIHGMNYKSETGKGYLPNNLLRNNPSSNFNKSGMIIHKLALRLL